VFATSEPRLLPLDSADRRWASAVHGRVSQERLRADLERLPGPRSRLHQPDAMEAAEGLICGAMRAAGWAVERQPYELRNAAGYLDYRPEGDGPRRTVYPHLAGVNLLAIKPGIVCDAVVVGAHYDTVRDSPGANDNTASVACLLELGRVLAGLSFRDTVILAAFDMEELGAVGSGAFVRQIARTHPIRSAVIFETMAYTDPTPGSQSTLPGIGVLFPGQMRRVRRRRFAGDWTMVLYRRSALELARSFGEALAFVAGSDVPILWRDPLDLAITGPLLRRVVPGLHNFARSDHAPFWDARLPAIMITDTANFRYPHYHEPTDTPEKLDYRRLADIVCATAIAVCREADLEAAAGALAG
jgi:Peptidase family M28